MKAAEAHGGLFTGERLHAGDPLFAADLARHVFAYRYAQQWAAGKRVLDAGCGDGYGTSLLAKVAERAVGVDREVAAIERARERYRRVNLRYEVRLLDQIDELGEPFDVVCHFQVIEHLNDPLPFLQVAYRVLVPGGRLLVTTPNRRMTRVENPYHVHEYVAEELKEMLHRVFPVVDVQGIWGNEKVMAFEAARAQYAGRILRLDPLGLHRYLPRPWIEWIYPRLARLVRRLVRRQGLPAITENDFLLRPETDAALDLLAVCRKEPLHA